MVDSPMVCSSKLGSSCCICHHARITTAMLHSHHAYTAGASSLLSIAKCCIAPNSCCWQQAVLCMLLLLAACRTTLMKSWVPGRDGPTAALNTEGLCDKLNVRTTPSRSRSYPCSCGSCCGTLCKGASDVAAVSRTLRAIALLFICAQSRVAVCKQRIKQRSRWSR
jgi:hypothetical protein